MYDYIQKNLAITNIICKFNHSYAQPTVGCVHTHTHTEHKLTYILDEMQQSLAHNSCYTRERQARKTFRVHTTLNSYENVI